MYEGSLKKTFMSDCVMAVTSLVYIYYNRFLWQFQYQDVNVLPSCLTRLF